MNPRFVNWLALLPLAAVLGACGAFAPPVPMPPTTAPAMAEPAQWQSPVPTGGSLGDLRQWWQQFDDPVLLALVDAAQAASPSIASAASRIEQARAARVGAGAALLPSVDLGASALRTRADMVNPVYSASGASVQASWEIDAFGANAAARDAAQLRLEGAQAGWYDARISVAAEVATTYNALRGCEALVQITAADVASRNETARLSEQSAHAGLLAPANAALSRASAAQGRNLLAAQRAQCDQLVKSLVALTALDESALRRQLAGGAAKLPQPATIAVDRVPGEALMQRPDLLAAERQVLAAAEDTARSQAQRYPRIGISGSLGPAVMRVQNTTLNGTLWTLGPLQVSLPVFDGGALQANVVAARARYDESVSVYRGLVRSAVREVESALVTLDSTARREADAKLAAEGFDASLKAADARYKGGLGSLFDLEEARRSALVANSTLVELQQQRVAAWISLYRALGGGWDAAQLAADPATTAATAALAAVANPAR